MTRLRSLTSETGSALPAVVGVMLVVGVLAAVIQQTATHVRKSTTEERAEKRAFQAAEAGLHVARYRLNMSSPAPTEDQCFTTGPVTASGDCPRTSPAESMGGGAAFTYTVTRVLDASSTECDVDGLDFADNDYRCITAIGTADGATRRVQAIVSAPRLPMFPVEGLFALGSLSIGPGNIRGQIGSNTSVSAQAGGPYTVVLGPSATYSGPKQVTTLPQDAVAPVNAQAFEATDGHLNTNGDQPTENDNSTIPGFAINSFREIYIPNSFGTVTVPPGTYNLCNIVFNGSTTLRSAGPGPVRIFIDSPHRANSGCRPGTGNFIANNQFDFTSSPPDASLVDIQMYGGPGTQFWLKNASTFHGTVYAPQSAFKIDNATTIVGSVVANTINVQNQFSLTGSVPPELTLGSQLFESGGWQECVRTGSSSSAAGAGC